MPTYEYACTECRRHVEAVQKFSDPPLTECEFCGGPLKRVFHPVGIVLKGSGFYATDSRSGKSLTSPKKDEAPAADSGSGKSSDKPADKGSPEKPKADKPAAPKKDSAAS